VFFAVDQSTLSPEAQQTLAAQAQWLNNQGASYAIIIEGHADEQGTREYNIALATAAPMRCSNYLVSAGRRAGPDAHRQLWQGTPRRGLLGRGLLCQEPPRRDRAVGRRGGLIHAARA
jgi:hypothetical protein